jgi:hypothetical protein
VPNSLLLSWIHFFFCLHAVRATTKKDADAQQSHHKNHKTSTGQEHRRPHTSTFYYRREDHGRVRALCHLRERHPQCRTGRFYKEQPWGSTRHPSCAGIVEAAREHQLAPTTRSSCSLWMPRRTDEHRSQPEQRGGKCDSYAAYQLPTMLLELCIRQLIVLCYVLHLRES